MPFGAACAYIADIRESPPGSNAGADPGFFLGGEGYHFFNTNKPHFFAEYQLYEKAAGHLRGGGGGGAHPLQLPARSTPAMSLR